MPIRLNDSQLRSSYASLENRLRTDPSVKIDASNMMKLLAGVADSSRGSAATMEAKLTRAGITRAEQVEIVKAGMGATEKADLGRILDAGTVPMTDEVKSFIGQVLGRSPVDPNDGALHISPSQAGGLISGTVAPGTQIEAINLSTAPEARLHQDDTFVLGKADASGHFSGRVPDMKEGDIVRLRTRDAQGNVGSWVTVRATGVSPTDTRNTQLAIFRIGLTDKKDGTVELSNINASRPIAEPGAKVQFTNERTGEKQLVTINDEGNFPANVKLKGRAGDSFSVRASDGRNNTNFSVEAGKVTVPGAGNEGGGGGIRNLPDPALHKDELNADGTPRFSTKRFTGPLFQDGVKAEDVKQGQIGDCYLPSAVAALAKQQPDALKNAIKDNGDGTFTVTFKERDWSSGGYKDKKITVDGDLYVRSYGGPLYGSSANSTDPAKMELWWPIFEKAYAAFHGSYNDIGNGGHSSDVFEAVLGKTPTDLTVSYSSAQAVWNKIKTSIDNGMPVSAGTYGEHENARYTNSGVYADHSYSILGYKEENGQKYVTMRNPWGESEPWPGDGKNDGIFNLKLEDFMKLYQNVMTVR